MGPIVIIGEASNKLTLDKKLTAWELSHPDTQGERPPGARDCKWRALGSNKLGCWGISKTASVAGAQFGGRERGCHRPWKCIGSLLSVTGGQQRAFTGVVT